MKGRILKKLKSIPHNHNINLPSPSLLLPPSSFLHHHHDGYDKENTVPSSTSTTTKKSTTFRRPSLTSPTLFDPDLLAAFHTAVADFYQQQQQPPAAATTDTNDPLLEYEDRCPPGGRDAVVVYTTSLRGVRKTFEDCTRVKLLLGALKVVFYERDVSMHLAFREDLWGVLGRVVPPRLFVRGRYVGGAEEVVRLHEVGRLLPLLRGLPRVAGGESRCCVACGGLHFLPCCDCHGSRRRLGVGEGGDGRCRRCNENGLVVCLLCSCRC